MNQPTQKILSSIPSDIVSVIDYQRYAEKILPHATLEYINGGVADDITLSRNTSSFEKISLYNRVLSDFSDANTRCHLFSGSRKKKLLSPILLAPVAHQSLVHPEAELATAQAAQALTTPMIVSTLASQKIEDIAQHSNDLWFQLYWQPCREANLELINRAINADYQAIVITIDAPVSGLRNRAQRAGFNLSNKININLQNLPTLAPKTLNKNNSLVLNGFMNDTPTHEDLKWLRQQTDLPIIAKGISHPDDALMIKQLGFDGIVVSNHGGRTLDTLPASIDILPTIRKATGPDFTILLDSGIRRGSDIFKALALGANAVLIGRPQVWALAVAGPLGVAHMLKLLRDELEVTMALAGCPAIRHINQGAVFTA